MLILTSLANASFCRLFGGDFVAMLIVFVSTMAGFRLKQIMLEHKHDVRLTFLCCSFVSAVLSAGGHIFNIGATPEIALGTSVLYLFPGPFMDAVILTACLSLGLCAGMLIMGLYW